MQSVGPLLASGRDADIFEYGPRSVLRRSRKGRSMTLEAETMVYLAGQGYPVPAIDEVSPDGLDLVMERIDGPNLVDAVGKSPLSMWKFADMLAELHLQLHEVAPPDFLAPSPVGRGDRLVHLDLHPLNVLVGPKGPVVIDWTNAAIGLPAHDVGLAWVLMAAGEIPGSGVKRAVLSRARSLLVKRFLTHFDTDEVAGHLREVVAWKQQDANMSETEVATMRQLVAKNAAAS